MKEKKKQEKKNDISATAAMSLDSQLIHYVIMQHLPTSANPSTDSHPTGLPTQPSLPAAAAATSPYLTYLPTCQPAAIHITTLPTVIIVFIVIYQSHPFLPLFYNLFSFFLLPLVK